MGGGGGHALKGGGGEGMASAEDALKHLLRGAYSLHTHTNTHTHTHTHTSAKDALKHLLRGAYFMNAAHHFSRECESRVCAVDFFYVEVLRLDERQTGHAVLEALVLL